MGSAQRNAYKSFGKILSMFDEEEYLCILKVLSATKYPIKMIKEDFKKILKSEIKKGMQVYLSSHSQF